MLPRNNSLITAAPTVIGPTANTGVPARPRQDNPDLPDYEPEEEYNAWAHGGENQFNANELQVGSPDNLQNQGQFFEGKNRKLQGGANRARLAANLSQGQSASLLTGY